jgi:hypothetical protein
MNAESEGIEIPTKLRKKMKVPSAGHASGNGLKKKSTATGAERLLKKI